MSDIEQALAEAIRKPLMANGVDATANQGYHGWRCEHPDRYGPCDCFDELVRDVAIGAAATEPMQAIARRERAMARLAETGTVDPWLYLNDAVYHAIAYRIYGGHPPNEKVDKS